MFRGFTFLSMLSPTIRNVGKLGLGSWNSGPRKESTSISGLDAFNSKVVWESAWEPASSDDDDGCDDSVLKLEHSVCWSMLKQLFSLSDSAMISALIKGASPGPDADTSLAHGLAGFPVSGCDFSSEFYIHFIMCKNETVTSA